MLEFQYRLGRSAAARSSNVERAIEQYREILAAAPEHQPAVRALEGLFAAGMKPLEIGEILEPLYRMQGAWDT